MDEETLDRLNRYIHEGQKIVPGWAHQADLLLLAHVGQVQQQLSVGGHICEVGVFQGKSLVVLALLLADKERVYGIDLFSDDNLIATQENINRFVPNKEAVTLHKANTLDLDKAQLEVMFGGRGVIRYLHVDAGHEYFEVLHDLELLAPFLNEEGVLVMDDIYDRESPGVSLALWHYCAEKQNSRDLVPFMVGVNKLYLCCKACTARYQAELVKAPALAQCTRFTVGPGYGLLVPFSKFPMLQEEMQRAIGAPVAYAGVARTDSEELRRLARDYGPAEIWRSMNRLGRTVNDLL